MKKENKPIVITSIIAGVILIIALTAIYNSGYLGTENKITVEGTASIDATPDLMTIYYMIEIQAETSAEAKNLNNEIYDKFVLEILKLGFTKSALQTQSFNIYPNYEYNNGKQSQNG
ncbi:MAG: SIMPL domain-containing protein [Nanoarchaeota archaeon]